MIPQLNREAAVPLLGEPAKVVQLTVLVVIECNQCEAHSRLTLIDGQSAVCTHCGAMYQADRVTWDRRVAVPSIALTASRPVATIQ